MVANEVPSAKPISRRAQGHVTVNRTCDRREKRYAQLLAQGFPQWKAYQQVSGAKNKDTCEKQGQRWFARACVQGELARLRREMTEETAMTRAEKRNILGQVARGEETPPQTKVTAIAVDNRMTGDDEPFRKAAGDDLRVQFFVVRVGESERGELSGAQPGSVAELNVTPIAPALPEASSAGP